MRKFDPLLCQPHLKQFLDDEYHPVLSSWSASPVWTERDQAHTYDYDWITARELLSKIAHQGLHKKLTTRQGSLMQHTPSTT